MTITSTTTDPTFSRVPEGDEATGQDCVDLARAYGIGLDEWQAEVVRGILRETPAGWSAQQAGVCVARQSGKGQILLALELFGLFALGENILHTAHAVKTSSDAFRRLWAVIQDHEELARRVRRHSQMIGAEYVELDDGARIAFTTRSASAGRGLSVDRLVVDEAEDFPAHEVAALQPTVFSRPRAQSLFFGTAPGPTHDSESWETLRRAAVDGLNGRVAWFEWCAEYGQDIDDRELWVRVNPAVASGRVPLSAIEADRAVLPVDGFRAERLSMWVPAGAADARVFDMQVWETLLDEGSRPLEALSVGIDAPPSRESATVCLAGLRADGSFHLEHYTTAEGIAWLVPWVEPRMNPAVRAVVIDSRGALSELPWRASTVRPTEVGPRDVAAAAGALFDAVAEGSLRHRGQVELTRGIGAAKQRPMLAGQAFGWDRKAPGSSVLIAASLALWGVGATSVARPRRRSPGEAGRRGVVL